MAALINPQTKERHVIDKDAAEELRQAIESAEKREASEVVFRAMRLGLNDAKRVLAQSNTDAAS